jgi:hypothetical protein
MELDQILAAKPTLDDILSAIPFSLGIRLLEGLRHCPEFETEDEKLQFVVASLPKQLQDDLAHVFATGVWKGYRDPLPSWIQPENPKTWSRSPSRPKDLLTNRVNSCALKLWGQGTLKNRRLCPLRKRKLRLRAKCLIPCSP